MKYFILAICFFCSPSFAVIEVVDYLGQTVKLDKPAQRIVALAPHIVENLYTSGAGKKIVGAVDYCDFPESAKTIPRVGAISAYSIEAIVGLKPDLVIVWGSGLGGKVRYKLKKLGLTVYVDNPKSLNDISRSIRDFGVLSGTHHIAEKHSSRFDQKKSLLQQTYGDKKALGVFYQVWNDPLQTLNSESIISDVIRLCGGQNVFGDSISIAPKVSVESVIQVNPQVIIASGMGESRPEWLDEWLRWSSISAVKSSNLYFIPPDLIQRHTVRMLDGARMMCDHLEQARERLSNPF